MLNSRAVLWKGKTAFPFLSVVGFFFLLRVISKFQYLKPVLVTLQSDVVWHAGG